SSTRLHPPTRLARAVLLLAFLTRRDAVPLLAQKEAVPLLALLTRSDAIPTHRHARAAGPLPPPQLSAEVEGKRFLFMLSSRGGAGRSPSSGRKIRERRRTSVRLYNFSGGGCVSSRSPKISKC
ncbi:unnamed protein product, partial [Urochloa humidicola]